VVLDVVIIAFKMESRFPHLSIADELSLDPHQILMVTICHSLLRATSCRAR
jgi:hypothetical protein